MSYGPWAAELRRWAVAQGLDVALIHTVRSTNEVGLWVLAETEKPIDAWIFARRQKAGRGRFDRVWVSPEGAGVYASRLAEVPSTATPALPLLIGAALCESLRDLGFECRLKWPNDVLLHGAKVGGILIQSRFAGDRARVVAGFGVNRGHSESDLARVGGTSLEQVHPERTPSLATLSIALAGAVDGAFEDLAGAASWAPRSIAERYVGWTAHRAGDSMTVTTGTGALRGRFAGFSDEGHLRLRTAEGERLLAAGEVTASKSEP